MEKKFKEINQTSSLINLSKFDSLTTSFVPKNSRVLDLGCADGKIGQFMEKELTCNVTGVESNPNLAQIAPKRLTKVIIGDLESPTVQAQIVKQGKFDVFFASAVLEHLKKPEIFIKNIHKNLNKDGLIIITLPNIAFWQVRFNLLFGSFQYTDSGILDKTHLKFFTVKTASHFIEKECNLKIKTVDYDFPQLPILSKFLKFLNLLEIQTKIFKRFPNIFAYQILFVAKSR